MLESGSVDTVFSTVLLDVFVHLGTQWKGAFVNDSHHETHLCMQFSEVLTTDCSCIHFVTLETACICSETNYNH